MTERRDSAGRPIRSNREWREREEKTRRELVKLRISVARVAQAAGISLSDVGLPDDAAYQQIHVAASTRERGWNMLAGQIVGVVGELRRANAVLAEECRTESHVCTPCGNYFTPTPENSRCPECGGEGKEWQL